MDSTSFITLVSVFLTQVGARHLIFDFTDAQRRVISHPITQASILFGMFFFSTRSVPIAISLVAAFYVVFMVAFNEHHPLNIFSTSWLGNAKKADIYYENMAKLLDYSI